MRANRYLPTVSAPRRVRSALAIAVGAGVTLMFVWLELPLWVGLLFGVLVVVFTLAIERSLARQDVAVAPIAGLRDDFDAFLKDMGEGNYEAALPLGKKLATFCRAPTDVKVLLSSLAVCAEHNGDFDDAEDLTARALAVKSELDSSLNASLLARRAFNLAALGRPDDAEATLGSAQPAEEDADFAMLALRVRALVSANRGEHARVVELLEGQSLGKPLGPRSIALLERLRHDAAARVGQAYRQGAPAGEADAALDAWIARALRR